MFNSNTIIDLSVQDYEMLDTAHGTQGLGRVIYAAEWHVYDAPIGRIGLIAALSDLFPEFATQFLQGLVDLLIGDDDGLFLFREEHSGELSRHQRF